jgi:hypothetical protein
MFVTTGVPDERFCSRIYYGRHSVGRVRNIGSK